MATKIILFIASKDLNWIINHETDPEKIMDAFLSYLSWKWNIFKEYLIIYYRYISTHIINKAIPFTCFCIITNYTYDWPISVYMFENAYQSCLTSGLFYNVLVSSTLSHYLLKMVLILFWWYIEHNELTTSTLHIIILLHK